MALVTEDGTGLTTSNGYVTVAEVTTHATDRGGEDVSKYANWFALGSTEQDAVVVRASDYLDGGRYRYAGVRSNINQAMEWPRIDATYRDDDRVALGVPVEVKDACMELCFIAADGTDLVPSPTYDDSNRFITKQKDKVGPLESEIEYSQAGAPADFRKYPIVDKLLRFLLIGGRDLMRQ